MKTRLLNSTKKYKILFLLPITVFVLFALTSCMWRVSFDSLTGSGKMTTEQRTVENFDKLEINSYGKLIIKQADKESLKIEGEDNILSNLVTEVENNKLVIKFKNNSLSVISTKELIYYLNVKDLTSLVSNGAVSINAENLTLNNLFVKLNGAEKITISGTVEKQEIEINGAGYYDAKNFSSKDCSVTLNGAGGAAVRVSEKLNASIAGAGSIQYIGNPEITKKINGIGKIEKIGE
jgi:hypothetical protein